jgi:hypothetical protein
MEQFVGVFLLVAAQEGKHLQIHLLTALAIQIDQISGSEQHDLLTLRQGARALQHLHSFAHAIHSDTHGEGTFWYEANSAWHH